MPKYWLRSIPWPISFSPKPPEHLLPHVYPFRFLDREEAQQEVRLQWTADGYWGQGGAELTLSLAVEMMAQACVAEAPEEDRGSSGYLAGIQGAKMVRAVQPGEVLIARTELVGKLGSLAKVSAQLCDQTGAEVARADLLLAIGT